MSIELDEQSKLLAKLLTESFPNLGLASIPIAHYNDAVNPITVEKIFRELLPIKSGNYYSILTNPKFYMPWAIRV